MKRIIGLAIFVLLFSPLCSIAMPAATPVTTDVKISSDSAEAVIAAHIVQRVSEIQAMDLALLSPAEKKALRKELKQLKHQSDGLNSTIYISVGAAIIIILLLILILR